jgi:hypothetical protein
VSNRQAGDDPVVSLPQQANARLAVGIIDDRRSYQHARVDEEHRSGPPEPFALQNLLGVTRSESLTWRSHGRNKGEAFSNTVEELHNGFVRELLGRSPLRLLAKSLRVLGVELDRIDRHVLNRTAPVRALHVP